MKQNLLLSLFASCTFTAFAQWTDQATGFFTPTRGINSIDIVDANTVWAGAYDGTNTNNYITEFSRTANGGASWVPGTVNTGLTGVGLANISAVSDSIAWACIFHPSQSVAGGIWKTTDAGSSWTQQTTAAFAASSFPDFVYFWDVNNGIAVGDPSGGYFEVYTTSDGGAAWVRTPNTGSQLSASASSEYGYTNGFSVIGGTLWFGTTTGRVFKTADKGLTFTNAQVGNNITDAQRVTFADADTGYACMHTAGNKGYKIARTTDGGATWTNCINNSSVTNTTVLGADICAVPGTNMLVSVGSDPAAIGSSWSSDGGVTWSLMEDTSLAPQRLSVRFTDASTGWAGTFNINQATSGISEFNGTLGTAGIARSEGSLRVFPNPANEVLSVNLSGFSGKHISIEICGLQGQRILQEQLDMNTPFYLKHFDVSGIAPGLYFIAVKDGSRSFTGRFVKQ